MTNHGLTYEHQSDLTMDKIASYFTIIYIKGDAYADFPGITYHMLF